MIFSYLATKDSFKLIERRRSIDQRIQVTFDRSWDATDIKQVVFQCGKLLEPVLLDEANSCDIPITVYMNYKTTPIFVGISAIGGAGRVVETIWDRLPYTELEVPDPSIPAEGDPITLAQVKALITAAIDEIPEPPICPINREVVSLMITEALASFTPPGGSEENPSEPPVTGITEDRIRELIAEAIGNIPEPTPGLTESEVSTMISAAIAGISIPENPVTEEKVAEMITTEITKIEIPDTTSFVNEERVSAMIAEAIAALPTNPSEPESPEST